MLKIYPNIAASANVSVNDVLPVHWNMTAVVAGGTGVTATIEWAQIV